MGIKMWANNSEEAVKILSYFSAVSGHDYAWEKENFKNFNALFLAENGYVSHATSNKKYFDEHHYVEHFLAQPVKDFVEVPEVEPPIGLRPIKIVKQQRVIEVCEAIIRYQQAGKDVPKEWINELCDLTV